MHDFLIGLASLAVGCGLVVAFNLIAQRRSRR